MKPPPRPAVGRPALYCEEVHQRLVAAASVGMFRRMQAMYAGIGYRTLETWLEDAEKNPETSPYGKLRQDLERAESERLWESLVAVGSGRRNWQAQAWYAERKYPSEYGRQVREHVGKDGGPMEFIVTWPKSDSRIEGEDPKDEDSAT